MIDLRSDTITKPCSNMLEAMLKANVGDDVYGEDPTVKQLEKKICDFFGTEMSMFFPSGTMANQTAIKLHTSPGNQVITHKYSHVFNYEGGGGSFNSGVSFKLLDGPKGIFEINDMINAINPKNFYHAPLSKLVVLENTTNKGGGACWDVEIFHDIKKVCEDHDLGLHMDGARIWNSLIANKNNPLIYGENFDTISVCLSKGLGCPIGSVLTGKKEILKNALRIRKIFGGGMRQVGYLAAAGIYALNNNIDRLAEDHNKAKQIAKELKKKNFVKGLNEVETNIIIIELIENCNKQNIIDFFTAQNVIMDWHSMGLNKIRLVTHLDYTDSDHKNFLDILDKCVI